MPVSHFFKIAFARSKTSRSELMLPVAGRGIAVLKHWTRPATATSPGRFQRLGDDSGGTQDKGMRRQRRLQLAAPNHARSWVA